MSRKNDVDAILKAASEQHKEIKAKYDDALRSKSMDLRIWLTTYMKRAANPDVQQVDSQILKTSTSHMQKRSKTSGLVLMLYCQGYNHSLLEYMTYSFRYSLSSAMIHGYMIYALCLTKTNTKD